MNTRTILQAMGVIAIAIMISFGDAAAQDQERPPPSYKILPGDLLLVSVWKEPDLQLELLVRPDGAISFPLAGGDLETQPIRFRYSGRVDDPPGQVHH